MKFKKIPLILIILLVTCAFFIWFFIEGRKELDKEREKEQPVKVESRLSKKDDKTIITLDEEIQKRSGFILEQLIATTYQKEIRAYAIAVEEQKPDILVQVIFPSELNTLKPPQQIWIDGPNGRILAKLDRSAGHWNSISKEAASFYSLSEKESGLVIGEGFSAYASIGQRTQGVFIPATAVVWWEGQTWAYIREDENHFIRRKVPTSIAVKDGWFVTDDFKAGELILIKGAQMLLSEELKDQIQAVGEAEEGEGK